MRHQHHGTRIALEEIFQPLDRLDVQVVGGFVEQQKVRLLKQQLGQLHTHLPTTAKLCHWAREVTMLEPQAQQNLFGILLSAVGSQKHHLFGYLVVAVEQSRIVVGLIVGALGNLVSQLLLKGHQVIDTTESRKGLVYYCAGGVGHHLLRQIAHLLTRGDDHRACLRLLPAAEYLHQGRLSRTILPHQPHAVVVSNIESHFIKQISPGELHRQIIDSNHRNF